MPVGELTPGGDARVSADVPTGAGSRVAAVGAALFLPTVLFVSAANNIMLRNLTDLPYRAQTVGLFLGAFLLCVGLTLPAFLRVGRSRFAGGVGRACLLLGVCVLLFDLRRVLWPAAERGMTAQVLLDEAVALVPLVVLLRASWRVLLPTFGTGACVLLVFGVGDHAHTLWREARVRAHRVEQALAQRAQPGADSDAGTRGNVYHIILDSFQREVFTVLQREGRAPALAGFTQYSQFLSSYNCTYVSVPNTLTGRVYQPGESVLAWQDEALVGGLWGDLAAAGVALHLFPHFPDECSPLAEECADTLSMDRWHPTTRTVDIWFMSLLPESVRRILDPHLARNQGGALAASNHAQVRFSVTETLVGERGPRATRGHPSGWSVDNFERMLATEKQRPAHGQYVFMHAMPPHGPYVLDAACLFTGGDQNYSTPHYLDRYMEHAECALRLVDRLVERLRALDRLDDALIVVHADHGMWPLLQQPFVTRYAEHLPAGLVAAPDRVAMSFGALLLVKFPGATTFATDERAAQMIDVAPSILTHFGRPAGSYPGLALQGPPPATRRAVQVFDGWVGAFGRALVGASFEAYEVRDGRWERGATISPTL